MAKKIQIDIEVNGKMQKATVSAKKLEKALRGADNAADNLATSAHSTDRRLKGAAQASSNSTKNFSKMAQGISGGLVPAYATLAANLFAVSAAFEFLKNAAQLKQLEAAQISFAQNTGQALASITERLRDASMGMLGFQEAAQAAAIGTAKGFSPAQLNELAEGALKASQALGRNFADSFDRLVRGVSKAEPELLDELGITLRLEKATNDYANALGIQADSLTDVQRSQAVLLSTQRQLEANFGKIDPRENAFVQLGKTFEDIVRTVSQAVLPVFEGLAGIINRNASLAFAAFAGFIAMIAKAVLPVGAVSGAIEDFGRRQAVVMRAAKIAQIRYKKQLDQTITTTRDLAKAGQATLQRGAGAAVGAGSKSKILQQVATSGFESLAKVDQANLKRMLNAAKGHVNEFGIVTKGSFAGVSATIVREMDQALTHINNKTKITETKMKFSFRNIGLGWKIMLTEMKVRMTAFVASTQRALTVLGGAFSKFYKFLVGLLSFNFIFDIIASVKASLIDMFLNLTKVTLNLLNLIPGIEIDIQDALANAADSPFGRYLQGIKDGVEDARDVQTNLDNLKRSMKTFVKDVNSIAEGAMNTPGGFNAKQTLTAYSSLNASTIMNDIMNSGASESEQRSLAQEFIKSMKPMLQTGQFEKLRDAIVASGGDLTKLGVNFKYLEDTANEANAEFNSFNDQLTRAGEIGAEGNFDNILNFIDQLGLTADNANAKARLLGETFGNLEELIETAFGQDISTEKLIGDIQKFRTEEQRLADNQVTNAEKRLRINTITDKFEQNRQSRAQDIVEAEDALDTAKNQVLRTQTALTLATKENRAEAQRAFNQATRDRDMAEDKLEILIEQQTVQDALNDNAEAANNLQIQINYLSIAKQLNDAIGKRLDMEQQLGDLAQKQIDRENRARKRERARTPMQGGFIGEINNLKDDITAQEALIARMETQGRAQMEQRKAAIDLEYDLLAMQMELEANKLARANIERANFLEQKGFTPEQIAQDPLYAQTEDLQSKLMGQAGQYAAEGEGSLRALAKEVVEGGFEEALAGANEELDKMNNKLNDLDGTGELEKYMSELPDTMAEGFTNAFMSIMDGTKSVKEAFGQMAKAIIADIMKMIVKLLIQKAIMAAMGMADGGVATPSGPALRYGGIVKPRGYRYGGYTEAPQMAAIGGVFKGPSAGYPVIMHGTEAVVPLPNGREIPVEMKGGGGQNNNVTVNVAMDNAGGVNQTQSNNGQQAAQLGNLVAAAVQRELQNQKRAGGILSPYGAA